jgi:DNA-binding response OmpR family regulator
MNALCCLSTADAERDVRVALRLRWPDAHVAGVRRPDDLLRQASATDVVFLDDLTPDFAIVRALRAATDCGIIVLTGEPSEEGILAALGAGADDYLGLPLSPALLIARLGALLRRVASTTGEGERVVKCGPLDVHLGRHEAYLNGNQLHLTPTEFNLLHHLAVARGGTITASALQRLVWECEEPIYLETLRKYVQRLRKKLSAYPTPDLGIIAIRGVGYRLAYAQDAHQTA